MNSHLQKIFTKLYSPEYTANSESGASSVQDTRDIRQSIENLFVQYNIKSMFDAGCNDCEWMSRLVGNTHVAYQGGDISLAMVAHAWKTRPNLDVRLHDATSDPFPQVDLLFVRDVAIHLNNADKKKLWQNWLDSDIPWILITHNKEINPDNKPPTDAFYSNKDIEYSQTLPEAMANWELEPWCFPTPTEQIWEYGMNGKCLALWHRTQVENLL
jgi:hypothetical protein